MPASIDDGQDPVAEVSARNGSDPALSAMSSAAASAPDHTVPVFSAVLWHGVHTQMPGGHFGRAGISTSPHWRSLTTSGLNATPLNISAPT